MKQKYPLERPRCDGEPGKEIVTETTRTYLEPDGSDKRVKRVKVYNPDGSLVKTYLEDEMGVPFKDNLGYQDR